MKYYVIKQRVDYGTNLVKPLCAVENEEIAKDMCKRYNGLTYSVFETEEEAKTDD